MWGRVGYAAAIIGTVIGGAALCLVVAAVMYIGIYAFVGTAGTGQPTNWGNVFPFSLFVDSEQRNSPRVVIRGDKSAQGCTLSFGLASSPGTSGSRTKPVWQDRENCEFIMEIHAIY